MRLRWRNGLWFDLFDRDGSEGVWSLPSNYSVLQSATQWSDNREQIVPVNGPHVSCLTLLPYEYILDKDVFSDRL